MSYSIAFNFNPLDEIERLNIQCSGLSLNEQISFFKQHLAQIEIHKASENIHWSYGIAHDELMKILTEEARQKLINSENMAELINDQISALQEGREERIKILIEGIKRQIQIREEHKNNITAPKKAYPPLCTLTVVCDIYKMADDILVIRQGKALRPVTRTILGLGRDEWRVLRWCIETKLYRKSRVVKPKAWYSVKSQLNRNLKDYFGDKKPPIDRKNIPVFNVVPPTAPSQIAGGLKPEKWKSYKYSKNDESPNDEYANDDEHAEDNEYTEDDKY
jgi:hypothetical protein